jgi:SOS-response transcriptional repressor LexA
MTTKNNKHLGRPRSTGEKAVNQITVPLTPTEDKRLKDYRDKTGKPTATFVKEVVFERLDHGPEVAPVSVPFLGTVPCGPLAEAIAEADTTIRLPRTFAEEIGATGRNFFIRARGQSMEGEGIHDEMQVLFEPLPPGADPRKGKIALVQITRKDASVEATIKTWKGRDGDGVPQLADGAGKPVKLPGDTRAVVALAVATAVTGRL